MKGNLPFCSTSTVNLMPPCWLLRWSRKSLTRLLFTIDRTSSTYLYHTEGAPENDFSAFDSRSAINKFATGGDTGDPITKNWSNMAVEHCNFFFFQWSKSTFPTESPRSVPDPAFFLHKAQNLFRKNNNPTLHQGPSSSPQESRLERKKNHS